MTTVIGLTGGIASGKSVVREMLQKHGAYVIDADKLGHEAYAPGSDCYRQVIATFGQDIVGHDGQIDRKALGGKVFADPSQRKRLEGIVWPWMRHVMEAQLQSLRTEAIPVVVLEAAVLIEANWQPLVDEVWTVIAPPDLARTRIMERNGLSADHADARIKAQLTNEERAKHAQVIIENSGTLEDLGRRVDEEWRRLEGQPQGSGRRDA